MTFEDYLTEVVEYFQIGGVTWGQAYWRVLQKHRPELAVQLGDTNPADDERYLGAFFYSVFTRWYK